MDDFPPGRRSSPALLTTAVAVVAQQAADKPGSPADIQQLEAAQKSKGTSE